ncbi:helix-turn-helix domain-containing protein [Citrobacter sp. S-77]|uniref:helix-turn-helix domain-containing protein n=1 Tax=Citrobacter sp. S-77 TaxID=1080067 RepID=UPI0005EF7D5C|nr:helix-turn-helix domain-containing protein [Citrobacter sp. S-77]
MNSKNQQAVIRYLLDNGEATPRELADVLGVPNKKIHNLLQNMQRYGRLEREGKKYRLAPSWQEKVCIAKSALERQTEPKSVAVQECRRNWKGYQVHKIFGSSRVAGNRV